MFSNKSKTRIDKNVSGIILVIALAFMFFSVGVLLDIKKDNNQLSQKIIKIEKNIENISKLKKINTESINSSEISLDLFDKVMNFEEKERSHSFYIFSLYGGMITILLAYFGFSTLEDSEKNIKKYVNENREEIFKNIISQITDISGANKVLENLLKNQEKMDRKKIKVLELKGESYYRTFVKLMKDYKIENEVEFELLDNFHGSNICSEYIYIINCENLECRHSIEIEDEILSLLNFNENMKLIIYTGNYIIKTNRIRNFKYCSVANFQYTLYGNIMNLLRI